MFKLKQYTIEQHIKYDAFLDNTISGTDNLTNFVFAFGMHKNLNDDFGTVKVYRESWDAYNKVAFSDPI